MGMDIQLVFTNYPGILISRILFRKFRNKDNQCSSGGYQAGAALL